MKKSLLLLAFLTAATVFANPVSPEGASVVARNFLTGKLSDKTSVELTLRTAGWHYDGLYLFDCAQGGWVIVAADDSVTPILGYSTSGRFDPVSMSPALRQWLDGYQEQLSAVRKARAAGSTVGAYPADAAEWERLRQGIPLAGSRKDTVGVGPLITTYWDQSYPYNQLCPGNSVTGCAATAMAMYMKFWNYPAFGSGSKNYNPARTGTTEYADFAHTLYDWDHMPDNTSEYDTPEEITAVATLMYHCGVALSMDYGTDGSGALGITGIEGMPSMDNALKNYFHYSRNMTARFKDLGYTNASWRALLITELDEGRPILYGGAATQGGHGFICDGYDERQYLHFNFGWSGTGNGYYPVDSISPGVGGVGGNVTYTFNLQNSCIIGAVPDYGIHVSDTFLSYLADGGSDSLLVGINETNDDSLVISSDADWLSVAHDSIGRAGWVRLQIAPMTDGDERTSCIVIAQGNDTVRVRVVQVNFIEEEMCPLTVVMENTSSHLNGWQQNACLTLQTQGGFIFGTAHLDSLDRDSVQILVAPKDIYCVWHSGGGTDRFVNYWVRNQYDEDFVSVVNAYRNGGEHLIPWPCVHLSIDEVSTDHSAIYPNPAQRLLHIRVASLQRVEIVDLYGRTVQTSHSEGCLDISRLPRGHYLVRIVTPHGATTEHLIKK